MARRSFGDILALVAGRATGDRIPPDQSVLEPSTKTVSDTERRALLQKATMVDADIRPGRIDFVEYLKATAQSTASTRIENNRIRKMAPEVSQAAAIMIASILSPNDMKDAKLKFDVDAPSLDDEQKVEIGEIVTNYLEEHLHLSTAVPRYIEEALYQSGAKPLLLIPLSVLDEQMVNTNMLTGSIEAFDSGVRRLDQLSLYGFSDQPVGRDDEVTGVVTSTESYMSNLMDDLEIEAGKPEALAYHRKETTKENARGDYKAFVASVLSAESLTVTDNAQTMRASNHRNTKTKSKITNTARNRFAPADLIVLGTPIDGTKPIGNPVFIDLPSESTIPLYTPGTPSDHIGYFIMLDERGHPLSIADYNADGIRATPDNPNQNQFAQLFQAYGYSNTPTASADRQDAIAGVYQHVVEAHLKQRAAKAGFADVGLGSNQSIFRYMFSRYLQQRRTKILFVPKDLLTYFCYKYNEEGMGVSKLDDIKFILSLRITLLTCRMLSAFNNAINRRKIEINFNQDFAGDLLEHMKTIQREVIKKSAVVFSHDPLNISQQVAEKSYTLKATGVPGIADYSVTNEQNDTSTGSVDDQLFEDVKNSLILDLDVPAAAMNSVGENEYSRSVATADLMFSRKLVGYQNPTKNHISELAQRYVMYSDELCQKIMAVVKNSNKKDKGDTDNKTHGDIVHEKNGKDVPALQDIISHIHLFLPSPNVAPDGAQFENLEKLVQSIDTLVNVLIPEDVTGDDADQQKALTSLRALAKADTVRKLIKDIGFDTLDLPDMGKLNDKGLLDARQHLINITAGLLTQIKLLKPNDGTDALGGASPFGDDGSGLGDPGSDSQAGLDGNPNVDPTADPPQDSDQSEEPGEDAEQPT